MMSTKNNITTKVKNVVDATSNKIRKTAATVQQKVSNYQEEKTIRYNRKVRDRYNLESVEIDPVPASITLDARTNRIISLTYRTRNKNF